MPLTPGTRFGPYEIVAPLGAGGMGEVYRAKDSRLGRDVAIKVLPQHLSANAEVRARFEREAKTVSSLNHPNICTLFDVGREGDTDFLVMELVEGETLAMRLAKGALPAADVLRLGAQIADALDRAHRAGVIHRDLKPGNVMLTRSGAKLMDFGLARATGLAGPASGSGPTHAALTQSPTMAAPLTAEGTIVGTFQYMAPEQLEGRETDARSDLWALGCVLYEMATGRGAFRGATQASLISAIMRDQPPAMADIAPASPPALERLVRQCLAKDPDDRWQSAGDVRRELEWIGAGSSSGAVATPIAPRRRVPRGTVGLLAGGLIAAAALVYALGPWSARRAESPLTRFMLAAPAGTTLSQPAEAAVSPDGSTIVFGASDSGGTSRLYLRPRSSPEARVIPGTEGSSLPFWSPDGRQLGFFANGKLRRVALDGSPPAVLCDAPDARGGTWSGAGVIVFAPNRQGPLARVSATGGAPAPVTHLHADRKELGHRYPQFLPDGRHFLFAAVGSGEEQVTYAASLDGGEPAEVCRAGSGAVYFSPGWLLYLDAGVNAPHRRLLARRFDTGRLRPIGDAQLVIDEVSSNNFAYANVAGDEHGTLVAQHWSVPLERLEWRDRHGAALGVAVEDFDGGGEGALSPDAKRLAYSSTRTSDLFVLDLASHVSTRLTFAGQRLTRYVWSRDGKRIAFGRLFGSQGWAIYMKAADGSGPDSLVFHGPGLFSFPVDFSPDGRWLVAAVSDAAGNYDLWKIPLSGGQAEPYEKSAAQEQGATLSPDGRWIAFIATEAGQSNLYVQSFPEPGSKSQITFPNPTFVAWVTRGDELLVADNTGDIHSVQVSTTAGFHQGATTHLFKLPPGVFPISGDATMQRFLTGSAKDQATSSQLEVVLGWPQLLEKK